MPMHVTRSPAPTDAPPPSGRKFVLGISGASGAVYAVRFIELCLTLGHELHVVVSDYGKRLLSDELDIRSLSLRTLCPHLAESPHADAYERLLYLHPHRDVGAVIASGSFLHSGMVVLPCSSTSLGAIATGSGSNLLTRAAMVTLKERRPLIIGHRESPLSLVDIENMRTLTLAGATVCPTNPGLYLCPESIDEIIDFVVGKYLDLLGIGHDLKIRWEDHG